MNIKDLRHKAGMTQKKFGEYLNIPKRTIENWDSGDRNPPIYLVELIKYKLEKEKMIMNKIVEEAKRLNEVNGYHEYIPDLHEGEIVKLNDLWDGEGEVPEDSYSYCVEGTNQDGVNINYEFEIVAEKENPLDTLIKITKIEWV